MKGQNTGNVMSDFAGDEVYLRKESDLFGDSFQLRAFKETLEHLKWEVNHCFEWVKLGLGFVGLGPRPDPKKSTLPKTKPSLSVSSLSKNP